MFEYFYHEILRRTIISFGSLFNGISIKHTDGTDVNSVIRVPLAYGPTQKFLARLTQSPDLNKAVQMSLPRMSFEFTGMSYDTMRKTNQNQIFLAAQSSDKKQEKKAYLPVPYNMDFELAIMCKLNDDALQIVEQILPYFQPSYNITVDLVSTIGEKRDIPVILNSIQMDDDYEGDFATRRALIYTLRFTAKTYLFGPVQSATSDVIKKVTVGLVGGERTRTPERNILYSVVPTATKSYSETDTTLLAENVDLTETLIEVDSASGLAQYDYFTVGEESFQITEVPVDNKLTVIRGAYGTTTATHVKGAGVKKITAADDSLIELGDDFGFSGTV